jgi:hypothetical protein
MNEILVTVSMLIGGIFLMIAAAFEILYGAIYAIETWLDFIWHYCQGYSIAWNWWEEIKERLLVPYETILKDKYINRTGKIILGILLFPFWTMYVEWYFIMFIIAAPFYLFLYIFREKGDK